METVCIKSFHHRVQDLISFYVWVKLLLFLPTTQAASGAPGAKYKVHIKYAEVSYKLREKRGVSERESQVRFYSRQRGKGGTQKTGVTETKLIIGSMQTVQAGRQQSSRLNNTNHITSLTPLLSTLLALIFSLLTDASTCSSLAALCAGCPASGLAVEAAGARRSNLKLLLRYTALSLQKDLLVLFNLKQLSKVKIFRWVIGRCSLLSCLTPM